MTYLKREATLPALAFAGLCVALQAVCWVALDGPALNPPIFTCSIAALILAGAAHLTVVVRDTMDRRLRELHSDLILRATSAEATGLLALLGGDIPPPVPSPTPRHQLRRVP